MPKMRWRPGLRPGPRWGDYDALPNPPVGWGGGHPEGDTPSPIPTPLGAFGASIFAPSALSSVPLMYNHGE